jgi:hypothetical protein
MLTKEEPKNYSIDELTDEHQQFLLFHIHNRLFKSFKTVDKKRTESFIEACTEKKYSASNIDLSPFHYFLYYCPNHTVYPFYLKSGVCCNSLTDDGNICGLKIKKVNVLMMMSLKSILSIILSDPIIYNELLKTNKYFKEKWIQLKNNMRDKFKLKDDTEILNITDAAFIKILIDEGYYTLADFCLTFNVFIDEVQVWNRSKYKNVNMMMISINELPPELRLKEQYMIPVGAVQTRFKHNSSIFAPLTTQFQFLFKPQQLTVKHSDFIQKITIKCMLLTIIIGKLIFKKLKFLLYF